jgi:hypothetical protein
MGASESQYGIFVVFWFKDANRHDFPIRWQTRVEFENELEIARYQLAKEFSLSLACYVIDLTTMTRMHQCKALMHSTLDVDLSSNAPDYQNQSYRLAE